MENASSFVDIVRSSPFNYGIAYRYIESMLLPTFFFSVLYVVVVFTLKAFMANRKPYVLKPVLVGWNAFLAAFSILGSYYMSKALYVDITKHGVTGSYCKYGDLIPGQYGLWAFFFAMSKLIEVGDTVLLVLRKKPLIFLHWYHHMVTMNFAMLAYTNKNGYAGWMCWMNYTVHAIMYSYYCISSCGYRIPAVISRCITSSQILQFALTLVQMIHIGLLSLSGTACDFEPTTYFIGLAMEFSYLFLFGHFFYRAYVHNGGQKFEKQKQA
ncbi:hypothetical protein QR680_000800 [Steinernema hermaphroditum]|uniref:Elongation of very long chain fatty acids protein n=1 Tax=Steinernema hermaphroditum TaxID=289476 RepID=A0AA39LEY3_9BILA|nr:hypothetical protein QR680_000800 [Steinernema hermaphroditum]